MRKIKLTKGGVNSISYEVVNVNSKTSVDECKIKKKNKNNKTHVSFFNDSSSQTLFPFFSNHPLI